MCSVASDWFLQQFQPITYRNRADIELSPTVLGRSVAAVIPEGRGTRTTQPATPHFPGATASSSSRGQAEPCGPLTGCWDWAIHRRSDRGGSEAPAPTSSGEDRGRPARLARLPGVRSQCAVRAPSNRRPSLRGTPGACASCPRPARLYATRGWSPLGSIRCDRAATRARHHAHPRHAGRCRERARRLPLVARVRRGADGASYQEASALGGGCFGDLCARAGRGGAGKRTMTTETKRPSPPGPVCYRNWLAQLNGDPQFRLGEFPLYSDAPIRIPDQLSPPA